MEGVFTFPSQWNDFFRMQDSACLSLCAITTLQLSPLRQGEAQQYNKIPLLTGINHWIASPFLLWQDPSMAVPVPWFLGISHYPVSTFTQHHFTTAHNLLRGIVSSDFRNINLLSPRNTTYQMQHFYIYLYINIDTYLYNIYILHIYIYNITFFIIYFILKKDLRKLTSMFFCFQTLLAIRK